VTTVSAAPAITVQPNGEAVLPGTNVAFQVTATGTAPLTYQWTFNGTNLPNATADTLLLSNVQPPQAGDYAVMIANLAGSVTSAVAILTVVEPLIPLNINVALSQASVSFASELGSNYLLEYKHSLEDTSWTPVLPVVTGTGGIMTLQDTNPPADSRYYRVRSE
jgi:hypothetical protein